jgi:hypothetical protein
MPECLVTVHLGRVDMAVARLQRDGHGRGGFRRPDQEDSEAELRDLPAVVQHDLGNLGHCDLLLVANVSR